MLIALLLLLPKPPAAPVTMETPGRIKANWPPLTKEDRLLVGGSASKTSTAQAVSVLPLPANQARVGPDYGELYFLCG